MDEELKARAGRRYMMARMGGMMEAPNVVIPYVQADAPKFLPCNCSGCSSGYGYMECLAVTAARKKHGDQ